jgi:hypothetical protein
MSIEGQAEASTALSVVADLISHGPEYLVNAVPARTPVFPGPGHAPDDVVPDDVVGAAADEDVDDVEVDELLGAEVAVAGADAFDELDVELLVLDRHDGLGCLHHP